jgi:beta-mannan synthase
LVNLFNPISFQPSGSLFFPFVSKKMDAFQEGREGISIQFESVWRQIREPLIVPLLRVAVFLCLGMSLMMLVERVYMGIVICLVKLFGRKPEKCYKYETFKEDVELGNSNYPMVLIQVPMYNEREVNFQY